MAKTYRYSEIFYSFQGEAQLAGKPAVWLRFFGCNLECNGFGQMDPCNPDTYVLPYTTFDISKITRIEDLPVWEYGCDSSYSWSARYKKLVHNHTVEEICDRLTEQMKSPSNPEGRFVHPVTGQDTMLAFTGGEPMLQQNAMIEIIREFERRGNPVHTVTVETNATKPLSEELKNFIDFDFVGHWHWAMSPKLWTVSGEVEAVRPEIIFGYIQAVSTSVLKFVVNGSEPCWEELQAHVIKIRDYLEEQGLKDEAVFYGMPEVWVMPVGATKDEQSNPVIADIVMDGMRRGYSIATRNHCYVFGNVIGK